MRRRRWQLLSVLLVVMAFAALYAKRLAEQSSNVDDYLYARQTAAFLTGLEHGPSALAEAWRAFPTNSPLVPTLAMPLGAVSTAPHTLVLVQLPLLVGLLCAVAALLGQFGFGSAMRWVGGAVIVCLPPLLSYAVMFHFGLASALCVVGTLVAYFASDRFRERTPSILVGVALGCLSLTRVVSPVYVVALAIPILLDQVLDWKDPQPRRRNAAASAAVAFVIALPWWAVCGPSAVNYLRTAGYSSGSGFTQDASILDNEIARVTRTADESGWLLAGVGALLFVVGVVLSRRARRQSHQPQVPPSSGAHRRVTSPRRVFGPDHGRVLLVVAVALLGMVLLGTSSNSGTAFALPYVVLVACVGAAALAYAQPIARTTLVAALIALCVAGVLALVTGVGAPSVDGRPLWLSATPIRQQTEQALGCECPLPDADALNEELVDRIGTRPTLVLRDDAVVNPESLRVTGLQSDTTLVLRAPDGGETQVSEDLLDDVAFALSGRTNGPYHSVDLAAADAVLRNNGFREVFTERLSPNNLVVLWAAGGTD